MFGADEIRGLGRGSFCFIRVEMIQQKIQTARVEMRVVPRKKKMARAISVAQHVKHQARPATRVQFTLRHHFGQQQRPGGNRNNNQRRTSPVKGGQYIDPARFVKAAKVVEKVDEYQPHPEESIIGDAQLRTG